MTPTSKSIRERVEIRDNHRYGYRSGEWASLRNVIYYHIQSIDTWRWCYLVQFADGKTDYWPIAGGYNYEFRNAND